MVDILTKNATHSVKINAAEANANIALEITVVIVSANLTH